ncbi:MAG: YlmC/YmxH family sporulation protein [Firmicutes bacterium]|jgi:YlmC/YmxH family sporulation protein|nr:YlmC/YmxH family sporulation protein [Bacillota bacterium]
MRLSELSRKELVDLQGGQFWGPAGKADLLIDESTGQIKSLVLAGKYGFFGFGATEELFIPWSDVVKVGGDAIIISIKAE